MSVEFDSWLSTEIRRMLGDVPPDVVATLLAKSSTELQEFLTMFGVEPKDAYQFATELRQRKFEAEVVDEQRQKAQKQQSEQKEASQNAHFPTLHALPKKSIKNAPKHGKWDEKAAPDWNETTGFFHSAQDKTPNHATPPKGLGNNISKPGGQKSKKDREAEAKKKEEAMKKAQESRRICLCQGMKHGPLTNCLHCGRINCKEEGYGPCLFCGNELNFDGLHAEIARTNDTEVEEFLKAVEKAKKLVQFDREAAARTKVFDDASDWFSEAQNPWLTQAQRKRAEQEGKKAQQRKEAEKRKMHLTFDFFGRTIVAAQGQEDDFVKKERDNFESFMDSAGREQKLMEDMHGAGTSRLHGSNKELYEQLKSKTAKKSFTKDLVEMSNEISEKPSRYVGHDFDECRNNAALFGEEGKPAAPAATPSKAGGGKLVDYDESGNQIIEDERSPEQQQHHVSTRKELFPPPKPVFSDAVDEGMALTLHQPWASLIVAGFKRAEGRTWNVDGKNRNFNRGRIWIHAAVKEPEDEEVKRLEDYYRNLYSHYPAIPPLPSETGGYPTGCIIGCVDLMSITSQEEYRAFRKQQLAGPNLEDDGEQLMNLEENNSDYIFWLESPRKLAVPCKYTGDHKFWSIPKVMLKTLQRAVMPVRWPAQGLPQQFEINYDRIFCLKTGEVFNNLKHLQDHREAHGIPKDKKGISLMRLETKKARGETAEQMTTKKGKVMEVAPHTHNLLGECFVHLHDFLNIGEQQGIINQVDEIGLNDAGGNWFVEQIQSTIPAGSSGKKSAQAKIAYMSYGEYTYNFRKCRYEPGDVPINMLQQELYQRAIKKANKAIPKIQNRFVPYSDVIRGGDEWSNDLAGEKNMSNVNNKSQASTETFTAQVCTAEWFAPGGTIGLRQEDIVDTADVPVVYFNVGDQVKISFTMTPPTEGGSVTAVTVKSGDALVFGAKNREIFHGVQEVMKDTSPPDLDMAKPGRLGIILK